jgi:hypothetical protein
VKEEKRHKGIKKERKIQKRYLKRFKSGEVHDKCGKPEANESQNAKNVKLVNEVAPRLEKNNQRKNKVGKCIGYRCVITEH